METKKIISKSVAKVMAIIIFGLTVIVFLSCLVLHLNPLELEGKIFEFAEHHYFWFGFISFLIGMTFLRVYILLYEQVSNPSSKGYIGIKSMFENSNKTKQAFSRNEVSDSSLDYQFIEKNKINTLNFPKEDVLNSPEQIKMREFELIKSMSLGNRYKHKVKIFFRDINAKRYTETTIWYADTKYITIKGGIALPVRSIYKIEF